MDEIEDQPGEIWATIDGYSNYKISNHGRVKSSRPNDFSCHGNLSIREDKILKGTKDAGGYRAVQLCWLGKPQRIRVSKLVATYFCKGNNCPGKIKHIDGNITNDNYLNIIFESRDNQKEEQKTKTAWIEKPHINPAMVLSLREDAKNGMTYAELANKYQMTKSNARYIVLRITWKHVK